MTTCPLEGRLSYIVKCNHREIKVNETFLKASKIDKEYSIDWSNIENINCLRNIIIKTLEKQGFIIKDDKIVAPNIHDKNVIRSLHRIAVQHRLEKSKKNIAKFENKLIQNIAAGPEVNPEKLTPYLVEVQSGSFEELLFRYAYLHWSIPVSRGYGRRLRFLVKDGYNDKLIGIIGLGDPVFSLKPRDKWIGWDKEARRDRLCYVMDAFVLGAVPPYSYLLGGKLVAMLVASNEIRKAFYEKYGKTLSLIRKRKFDGQLALITTTSALGRSSIYNRLKLSDKPLFISCGYTAGSGEFHFANGVYNHLLDLVKTRSKPTAKQTAWGTGFRNKREVVRKGLKILGLSADWIYHGVSRELFVVPLAMNTRAFLNGEERELHLLDLPLEKLFKWFRKRWLLPRSERDSRWKSFEPACWRLWGEKNG